VSKWEKVKLEDICEILDHKRIPVTASERKSGIHPYYGANGIQDYVSDYIFDDELVLLAEDGGNFGSKTRPIAYRVSGKCWVNNHAHVLKANPNIDTDYLCYSIMFYDVSKIISGTTRAKLNQAAMKKMLIPLPPLETQKQIAQTVDTVAELLALRKKQLAELDNLIKATFYDMFGDPVTNEKGWEIGKVKDLAIKIQYGTSEKASKDKLSYPILRMNNITYEGNMGFSDLKYIDLSEKDKEKYLVYKGEMLFNRTNSKELVGKSAVYRQENPMAYAGYLVRLVPNRKGNSEYISAFLNSLYGKKLLLKMAKNIVGMANINARELSEIKIPLPPLPLQNKFAEIVTKIEEQKDLVQKVINETQLLFNSLMSEYFE